MLKIKEWKYDDMMSKVTRFGDKWMDLDFVRTDDELKMVAANDGFVTFTGRVEVEKETEKAMKIRLADSWSEWFPKSAIVIA